MKELINRIFARHARIERTADMDKVTSALWRLSANDDFQLFRAVLLQSRYADCARSLTSCDKDSVDLLRGQMFALDRLFSATSEDGIRSLEEDVKEQRELLKQIQQMEQESKIY